MERIKQEMGLTQKQTVKPAITLDIVDMKSVTFGAEKIAEKLVEKHKGNLAEIEKDILALEVPEALTKVKDFNFKEEILWAARWIAEFFNKR